MHRLIGAVSLIDLFKRSYFWIQMQNRCLDALETRRCGQKGQLTGNTAVCKWLWVAGDAENPPRRSFYSPTSGRSIIIHHSVWPTWLVSTLSYLPLGAELAAFQQSAKKRPPVPVLALVPIPPSEQQRQLMKSLSFSSVAFFLPRRLPSVSS